MLLLSKRLWQNYWNQVTYVLLAALYKLNINFGYIKVWIISIKDCEANVLTRIFRAEELHRYLDVFNSLRITKKDIANIKCQISILNFVWRERPHSPKFKNLTFEFGRPCIGDTRS